MIILDTHIWIWWVDDQEKLTVKQRNWIDQYQNEGLGISIISCWEIAKLVEKNRLILSCSVEEWLNKACNYPNVKILDLTLPIIIKSTQLIEFHQDPADQLIVATANIYDCLLLTADQKILNYLYVKTFSNVEKSETQQE
jgi:PIN domain nuclease of toxin-antitoxin system